MPRILAKTIDGRHWQSKMGRNRAVPIRPTFRRYLENYIRRIVPGGCLLPSPASTWWDPDTFSHDLADANRKTGLQWSWLGYRQTFGSNWAMKGESLYKIHTFHGELREDLPKTLRDVTALGDGRVR